MTRRLVAGALWFVAVSSLVTFAETLVGPTRQLGALFGVAVAVFVILDPLGRIWPTRSVPRDRASLVLARD